MGKEKMIFVCSSCGYESAKWLGKCPACNEWNSFYEEKIVKEKMDVSQGKLIIGLDVTNSNKEEKTWKFSNSFI